MLTDIEDVRLGFPKTSWVVHERLWGLQLKIIDKRLTHLMTLQGMAPERAGLSNLTPQQLREKLEDYQKQLSNMMQSAKVIKLA